MRSKKKRNGKFCRLRKDLLQKKVTKTLHKMHEILQKSKLVESVEGREDSR